MHIRKKHIHGFIVAERIPVGIGTVTVKCFAAVGFTGIGKTAQIFDLQFEPDCILIEGRGVVGSVGDLFAACDQGRLRRCRRRGAGVFGDPGIPGPGCEIRQDKLIGQATLTALKNGTGGLDHKTIAKLCEKFDCQPAPSIFGTAKLNFRVRNGNGWTLCVKITDFVSALTYFPGSSPTKYFRHCKA